MLENCEFPKLPAKYDIALRDAVSFVLGSFKAVGIIASGTILRGNPDATSHIDLWVIHLEPNRQRIQKFFKSVPVEIFVNPPWTIRTYFSQDQSDARPISAHMYRQMWPDDKWESYIQDHVKKSPVLRSYVNENQLWFSPEFVKMCQAGRHR